MAIRVVEPVVVGSIVRTVTVPRVVPPLITGRSGHRRRRSAAGSRALRSARPWPQANRWPRDSARGWQAGGRSVGPDGAIRAGRPARSQGRPRPRSPPGPPINDGRGSARLRPATGSRSNRRRTSTAATRVVMGTAATMPTLPTRLGSTGEHICGVIHHNVDGQLIYWLDMS